jgi:hypothetical protein
MILIPVFLWNFDYLDVLFISSLGALSSNEPWPEWPINQYIFRWAKF